MNSSDNPFRQLPSLDALLLQMGDEIARWGRDSVTQTLRDLLSGWRGDIAQGAALTLTNEKIAAELHQRLQASRSPSLRPLLNLTGTVLHTNLGRAALPDEALAAVTCVARGASNLEFDLQAGRRGERDAHVESLICQLTGAEAATVVNNNAAAVLLVLNTLAMGREVPVSRGELVEIGGSFRIPEVMARSGCTLVEIGATNRTHLKDYRGAIGDNTALLLKVHTSNYRIAGFTAAVEEPELAALAIEHGLPFMIDLGSGNLVDFSALGLPDEPTVSHALASGASVVTFSGDKLLGGPQAGIIAGSRELIERIRSNPLKRALRLDKMTLAALAEVLTLYLQPETLCERLPTLRDLTREPAAIHAQATRLLPQVQAHLGADFAVEVAECRSQIGSGSLPLDTLPSAALHITAAVDTSDIGDLAVALRAGSLPVIGRMHKNALWLDLRCLEAQHEAPLLEQFAALSR